MTEGRSGGDTVAAVALRTVFDAGEGVVVLCAVGVAGFDGHGIGGVGGAGEGAAGDFEGAA